MPVKYVTEFSFPASPPRPTARGYARGGHVNQAPLGQVTMTSPNVRNPKDASSPGSPQRTPPTQSVSSMGAAKAKFAQQGKGTPLATKQTGNVERMAGWSDFAKGGSAGHRPGCQCSMCGGGRIGNLGKFAHGGKVLASGGEKSSGTASKSPQKAASAGEVKSGTPKMAMGGMSRGVNPRRNAAIHAKAKTKGMPGKAQGLAKVVGALEGAAMPKQGPQAPPGMAPGMGAPPGQPMGAMAPQMPSMGQPTMSQGGALHVIHHVMR